MAIFKTCIVAPTLSVSRLFILHLFIACLLTAVSGLTQRAKFLQRTNYPVDCRLTSTGSEYAGTLNTTRDGYGCQAWNSNRPHYNYYRNSKHYPEGTATLAGALCRNPDYNYRGGPWCYTNDPSKRWDHCSVPFCGCKELENGMDYEGKINKTTGGLRCQRWNTQDPHRHNFTSADAFPEKTMGKIKNYCRNPNGSRPDGPWCYTRDPSRVLDYCTVPMCNVTMVIFTTTTSTTTISTTTTTTRRTTTRQTSRPTSRLTSRPTIRPTTRPNSSKTTPSSDKKTVTADKVGGGTALPNGATKPYNETFEPKVAKSTSPGGRSTIVYIVIGVLVSLAILGIVSGMLFFLWMRGLLNIRRIPQPKPEGISNPGYDTAMSYPHVSVSDLKDDAPRVFLHGLPEQSEEA